jgi:RNA polymerase sigma-70 factor, ECF subfamily
MFSARRENSAASAPRVLGAKPVLGYHDREPISSRAKVEAIQHAARRSASADETMDRALIASIARRDRHAFETLYYRFAPRLGRFLFKMLRTKEAVDEAVNDVMLVVWQSAERYDPSASAVSTWLFGIAHNKALKALERSRRFASEVSLESESFDDFGDGYGGMDEPNRVADPANPERAAIGRELGELLQGALAELSSDHRSVIELAFGEDFSYEQIASIMGCPVNTVKTRMFYARKRLAQLLAGRGVEGFSDA